MRRFVGLWPVDAPLSSQDDDAQAKNNHKFDHTKIMNWLSVTIKGNKCFIIFQSWITWKSSCLVGLSRGRARCLMPRAPFFYSCRHRCDVTSQWRLRGCPCHSPPVYYCQSKMSGNSQTGNWTLNTSPRSEPHVQ